MGAPYVPTKKKLALEILKEVKFKKNGLFVELGSGDGRIVRTAVRNFGVRGLAVDVNCLLIIWSRILKFLDSRSSSLSNEAKNLRVDDLRGDDKLTFLKANMLNVNLTQADYIYLFLFPDLIAKLVPKFDEELKKGTVIISHGFPVSEYRNKLIKKVERSPFPTYYYKK